LLVTRVVNGTFEAAKTSGIVNPESEEVFTLSTQGKGTLFNNNGAINDDGTLENGTSDNVRWEISQRDTGSGTFTLLIRRGDDKTNAKTILETFANVSLDPYSDNYIEKIVGNQVLTQIDDSNGEPFLQLSRPWCQGY
jgi:hypothetical protein